MVCGPSSCAREAGQRTGPAFPQLGQRNKWFVWYPACPEVGAEGLSEITPVISWGACGLFQCLHSETGRTVCIQQGLLDLLEELLGRSVIKYCVGNSLICKHFHLSQ